MGGQFEKLIDDVECLSQGKGILTWEDKTNNQKVSNVETEMVQEELATTEQVSINAFGVVGDLNKETVWGDDTVRQEQEKDSQLKFLMAWWSNGENPEKGELALADPATKFFWENRNLFFLSRGILFKKGEEDRDLLVVPRSLQREAVGMCHDIPSSGHQGIARTKARVKERFFWFRRSKEVARYVQRCLECSSNKSGNKGRHPRVMNHAGAPLEKVHMDFLGPLPKTKEGNEFVLVLVDNFTKWVECYPLASQTAEVTARTVVNEFFSRFGYPLEIITDQGRNFESSLFKEMCRILHCRKFRTTAFRPSANGQAEAVNKTLMAAVRCFVHEGQGPEGHHSDLALDHPCGSYHKGHPPPLTCEKWHPSPFVH